MTLSRFTRSTRACVQARTSRVAVVAVVTQQSQRVTEVRSIPNSARNKPRWETSGDIADFGLANGLRCPRDCA